jgi:hypothetical protein
LKGSGTATNILSNNIGKYKKGISFIESYQVTIPLSHQKGRFVGALVMIQHSIEHKFVFFISTNVYQSYN